MKKILALAVEAEMIPANDAMEQDPAPKKEGIESKE